MNALRDLGLTAARPEPRVWVQRLVILEQLSPEPKIVRDVRLERGVNIVWAEEAVDDDPEIEISGHSAGKTTFCRLLRYVLAETTYSRSENVRRIEAELPDGYVAAEISVDGRPWAVRRPFGAGRLTYILEDATIEDLLSTGGRSVSKEEYAATLGLNGLLESMPPHAVTSKNEPILWGHLLAWCARDQEARFRSLHDWRDPRSESGSPEFAFRRAGPLFVIRAALGLIRPDELGQEREIAILLTRQETLRRRIEDARREPELMTARAERRLAALLAEHSPGDEDLWIEEDPNLFANPSSRADRAHDAVAGTIRGLTSELESVQDEIDSFGAMIREREEQISLLRDLTEVQDTSATEIGSNEDRERRDKIEHIKAKLCLYGGVPIGECRYVQTRLALSQPSDYAEARSRELTEARFDSAAAGYREQQARLSADVELLRQRRTEKATRRSELNAELRQHERASDAIASALQELEEWTHHRRTETHRQIAEMEEELRGLERDQSVAEDRISLSTSGAESNIGMLNAIYSALVRDVVAADYDGQAVIEGRELAFQIIRGTAMGGEAVETLGILMADLASMVFSCVTETNSHPGFLIHDSPREADLGARLYRHLILAALSLESEFGGHGNCPFQYILTTTTAPPVEAQTDRHLKLRLDASNTEGLLLKRDVSRPSGLFNDSIGS